MPILVMPIGANKNLAVMKTVKFETKQEATQAIKLAFGRILRMGSRPSQAGDIEMYEKCKDICMEAFEFLGIDNNSDSKQSNHKPGWNFGGMVLD